MDTSRPAGRSVLALLVLAGALVVAFEFSGVLALLTGALSAAVLGVPAGSARLCGWLLRAGVLALGAGTELGAVLRVGGESLGATALTIMLALGVGLWLGRRLGLERDVALLVSVGTAICGGSAIAAAAPALRARSEHVAAALAVVFLLNAVALVLFPLLGAALGLDPLAFGRLCALAIHDTSSVVGAAATYGREALEVATVTKLARSLWIVPVAALFARFSSTEGGERGRGAAVPGFLLGFLALALVVELVPELAPAGELVAAGGRRALGLALFVLGLELGPARLRAIGPRPLGLGLVLFGLLTVAALGLVGALG
jgi:uncharacterized integral membrane protein (TIGR00698 family)